MKKLIYLLTFIIVTVSCTKEKIGIPVKIDVPVNTESSLKGILSFKDTKEFFSIVDSLNKLPGNGAVGYKAEDGFLSLLTIQKNYYDCLEKATDQAMYDNLILSHKEFLSEGSITDFKIHSKVNYPVLNKDGIVQIGNNLYKFTEDGEIILKNNNVELLLSLTTKDKETDDIKIFKNSDLQNSKSEYCSWYHTTGLIYNGDRRCHLTSWLDLDTYLNYDGWWIYKPSIWNEGIAEKRGIFGWRTYNTYNIMNLNFQVILNNGFSYSTTETIEDGNNYHIQDVKYLYEVILPPDEPLPHMGLFNFINVNSYSTGGMAGITAEIYCEPNPYGK